MKKKPVKIICTVLLSGLMAGVTVPACAEVFKAKLEWSNRVILSPLVKGYVSEVNVQPGTHVKKGDVLMRLAPEVYQARVDQFTATLKSSKAIMDEAKRELARSEEMYERTLLSDHDLQVDKNAYILARANYQETIAALKNARIRLEYTISRAPFDAIVLSRDAEIGQSIFPEDQPGAFLVVARDKFMQAVAWLTEEQANMLSRSDNLQVMVKGNMHNGKVLFIGLETKSDTEQLYKLVVRFSVDGQQYRAGMVAEIIADDV